MSINGFLSMLKIELKFQIPQEKRELIFKNLQRKNVQHQNLKAKYFDNDTFQLSQNLVSLRQRFENEIWIQTLKIATPYHFHRIEIEEKIETNNLIRLDQYQKDKQIPKDIRQLLLEVKDQLSIQFETEIERSTALFNFQNSQIEIALDRGSIFTTKNNSNLNIYEIEFELKQGSIQDLVSFILPRIKRYGLWLDIRNKAQQGFKLAQNIQDNPVQFQSDVTIDPKNSTEIALRKIVSNCLQHLLPNSTAIASENFNSNHIHQARVAIRRLRSALKTFSHWSKHIDLSWETELRQLFRTLGTSRDLNVIQEELIPQLEQVGAPSFKIEAHSNNENSKTSAIFRSLNFNHLILSLLQFIHQQLHDDSRSAQKAAKKQLSKLHQQIQIDTEHFLDLDSESQHRTRKRLKRLRYSIEFVVTLYNKQESRAFIKALKPAQESLGKFNDLCVAEQTLKQYVMAQPEIWFALGWIASQKQIWLLQSQRDLSQFIQAKPFWE